MIDRLIQIANELDSRGLAKEADVLDAIISRADDSMILPMPVGDMPLEEDPEDQEPISNEGVSTLDELAEIIDDPNCDLECAEDAALKYRSSLNYQENEDIERDIVNALVDSKRPEPGEEA